MFFLYFVENYKNLNVHLVNGFTKKGGWTEIDRQSLDFVVPAPRG